MKKLITYALLLVIFLSPQALAAELSDIPRVHTNYVAITHLNEAGILSGYPDGSFKPDKIVNRVEALKVILEGAGVVSSDEVGEAPFSDVAADQWFAKYVKKAKEIGIIKGNPDGTFAPDREVKRVEYIKMLLETNRFKKEKWENQQHFEDIPADSWYAPYMNYAGKAGLILPDTKNNLMPERSVSRGEMAETLYLMRIILKGKDPNYLVKQAELQMAQVEPYIGANLVGSAKRASELGYDLTQQALSLLPENNIVLGAAKIGKAYDLLVDAYIAAIQKNSDKARSLAELAKVKATEGWEANNDIQEIAKHLKERADEIISQL